MECRSIMEKVQGNTRFLPERMPRMRQVCVATLLALAGTAALAIDTASAADCRSDASRGVDWQGCAKKMLLLGSSNLEDANLYDADFSQTDLRYANLKNANLEKTRLVRTSIAGAKADGADFTKAEAYRSDFSGISAVGANFSAAEMQRTNFSKSILQDANFEKAELGRTNFSITILTNARFSVANLSRANFRGALLDGKPDFGRAFMFLTRIEGVNLSTATGLSQDQLDLACGDDSTVLPAGLTRPVSWPCPPAD